MHSARVANLGLIGAPSMLFVMPETERDAPRQLRAWRITFPDGQTVYSRGPLIHVRRTHRWQMWISPVDAPEIFVA